MKVICFGDSNTYGFDPRSYFGGRYGGENRWVDILAEKTGWQFENMGQNGLSIPSHEYDIDLYSRMLSRAEPCLLIVMLGSNDLLQGMSAEAAAKRMERFLRNLSVDMEKILLAAPVPFKPGLWVEDEKTIAHSARLGALYKELAKKLGIKFADAGDWKVPLCHDGVHFTETGHRAFADGLYNFILDLKEK